MFRKRVSSNSASTGRTSFGGASGGSRAPGGRAGGSRGGFSRGGGRSGGFGGRSPSRFSKGGPRIDINRFINKAKPVVAEAAYVPKNKFADFDIHPKLKENIVKKGFESTTPIQDQAIPHILKGTDVVGIANTGTGKTAAFLIPLINKVFHNKSERALIVVPTRELGQQILDEFHTFADRSGLRAALCIGGASMGLQKRDLRYNPNFVIGTPGRLRDLIEQRCIDLSQFKNIILDEADRMVDMGFIADIRFLIGLMPKERHSLFFSATISKEIEVLIRTFLRAEHISISVKSGDTAASVDQDIIRVPNKEKKLEVLHELLMKPEFQKVLIFGRTKHGVEKLCVMLAKLGHKVASIHGDKPQSKRQQALNDFKAEKIKILVATDVAARGIDIPNVSHVINFDIPQTYEDYVHRIGRTGRANKTGIALTFVE